MKKNKGISLITLIITIIVAIVLATAVILSLTKSNSVNDSKLANLLQSKANIESAINLKVTKEISKGLEPYSVSQILTENPETEIINQTSKITVQKDGEEIDLYILDKNDVNQKIGLEINKLNWYMDSKGKIYLVYDYIENVPEYMRFEEELNNNVKSFVIILGSEIPVGPETPENPNNPEEPETPTEPEEPTEEEIGNLITLTFESNGGTLASNIIQQAANSALTLPTPTREGYTFSGWYTSTTDGEKVSYTTMPTTSQTLYAKWSSGWDGTVATGFARGTGTSEDPYIIETASQLAYMQSQVNNNKVTYSGQYIKMVNNIDLNSRTWDSIGKGSAGGTVAANTYIFSGRFDGGGNSIYNLSVNPNFYYAGFFGRCSGATIENLTIESGSIIIPDTRAANTGGIVAYINNANGSWSYIEKCINKMEIIGEGGKTGGIVGYICGSSSTGPAFISDCKNYGNVSGYGAGTGGIVGYSNESIDITNCINYGTIKSDQYLTYNYVGGIIGQQTGSYPVEIYRCGNEGPVSGKNYVGGIAGNVTAGESNSIIECYNTKKIYADYTYAAGILAYPVSPKNTTINYCYNIGDVTAYSNYAGGIATAAASIKNCYSTGSINATKYEAGIASRYTSTYTYSNNYYLAGSANYALYNKASASGYRSKNSSELSDSSMVTTLNNGSTVYAASPTAGGYPVFVWQLPVTEE